MKMLRMLIAILLLLPAGRSLAAITINVTGPGGGASRTLPDSGGSFEVDLPLNANAVNTIEVVAADAFTNRLVKSIDITQLSLQSVAVAEIKTERLPPERVQQLVNEGVIHLDDPENYNVSQFNIVMTIAGEKLNIDLPIVMPLGEPSGYEVYRLPTGDGPGSDRQRNIQIIVFEEFPPAEPGKPPPPPIPGVMVIEGRIKSLKEFFAVRLLLMNTSGIFTLTDVRAALLFPDGGLSHVAPADGLISFGDILPGDGGTPGQKEREFIIRGDEIGERRVRVDFGGTVTGPGLPEENPIAFNGSATSSVEVKGPPSFLVQVFHPDNVVTGEPYEMVVEIQNTGELPALYASLEMEVGIDVQIETCASDPLTGETSCVFTNGPEIRNFGHIYPGERVRETFVMNPLRSGPVSSCLGISDQNIMLQVVVGSMGCLAGHYPPTRGAPDGVPTVTVIPGPNQTGVGTDSPVTAFFSHRMHHPSILPGTTFKVFDDTGSNVPGRITFSYVGERSVAVWQVDDQDLNRLRGNSEYTVVLEQSIKATNWNGLFNRWSSTFRTTSAIDDIDPPTLDLMILPPVNPNAVLPGEQILVNAYAADQGSGLARVELWLRDLDGTNGYFKLVDQKTVFDATAGPPVFDIDSANLDPGHRYIVKGTAFDKRGNYIDSTISFVLSLSADPPVVILPADPSQPVLHGITIGLTPLSVSGGVQRVFYYLGEATRPLATVFVPPWGASINTLGMPLGVHTVTVSAVDGLLQRGEDAFVFNLVDNTNAPAVSFAGMVGGAVYATGTKIRVNATVSDPVGLESVRFFLDDAQIFVGSPPFLLDTAGLATGVYTIAVLATNTLGIANSLSDSNSTFSFQLVVTPPGPPPPAPLVSSVSEPVDGICTVNGSSVSRAQITIANTNRGISVSVYAQASGDFTATIDADGGDVLRLTALALNSSPSSSPPTIVSVPVPMIVSNLAISPPSRTFTALGQHQDFTVTAQATDGRTSNVTSRSSFSSSAPGIVSVSSSGRAVAQSMGGATISASFGTNTATADVSVNIVTLTNLVVDPPAISLVALGQTAHLGVIGQYSDGTSQALSSGNTFLSGDPGVATVNSAGLVTATGDGQSQITVGRADMQPVRVEVSVITGEDPPPTVSILSPPGNDAFERNHVVPVSVRAVDPTAGVVRIFLSVTGVVEHAAVRQVSPPAKSITHTFNFQLPADAPIGGVFVAKTWAEDTSGNISSMAQVALLVRDVTPPAVEILEPAPYEGFATLSTVRVVVAVSDAMGVVEVGCRLSGAATLSSSQTFPPAQSTNVTFDFVIPPAVPYPDVLVHAWAMDYSSNTGTAVSVPIAISDADLTPPETIVTHLSSPGTSTVAHVTFEVLDGLDDLDHVELYFRRNGVGTFNRYTDADGGNPFGQHHVASGATGTMIFDSEKMGGDGFYEFYSIGVDSNGNRELPPVDADQVQTFNAGTAWVWITNSIAINETNTLYDNANVIVSNAEVRLVGSHVFRNVELCAGAVLTHPAATTTNEFGVNIQAWTLTLHPGASIDVSGRGYLGGLRGDNTGISEGRTLNNELGSTYRSGGSYGGAGAIYGGEPNGIYGNMIMPADLGSGGSGGAYAFMGGSGGGRIFVQALNIVNDGSILANGANGAGNQAGSGSGGSIWLVVSTLSGSGELASAGGGYQVGGGGGRVAVHHVDMSTAGEMSIHAVGGQGSSASGGNGTVFLRDISTMGGALVVDGQGVETGWSPLPIPPGYVFDNIVLRNGARIVLDDPLVVSNGLSILGGSIITHSPGNTNGVRISAGYVEIDSASSIDVTGKGYPGARREGGYDDRGTTLFRVEGAGPRAGGSYGGLGSGANVSPAYGRAHEANRLGSGGGVGSYNAAAGSGGGRMTIEASGTVRVEGALRADGQIGSGNQSGSGSGGAISVKTFLLRGSGWISARGGAYQVGGGGGRITVDYSYLGIPGDDFDGQRRIVASGGKGSSGAGSCGTVLLRRNNQVLGDLYIDEELSSGTSSTWSPLTHIGFGVSRDISPDTLILDGKVQILPGALIGLQINPNVSQQTTFTIVDNTTNSVTVDIGGGVLLSEVAAAGDSYAGVYRFDNVFFRRGAFMVLGDQLRVADEIRIEERGRLTHYDATTDWGSCLDIDAQRVFVSTNSAIEADARGYLGGGQPGNPESTGQTAGFSAGSMPESGGSHGGRGALHSGESAPIHGSLTAPTEMGGGGSQGSFGAGGGNGGGRIRIRANTLSIDGELRANGMVGEGNRAGDGAGGSILLDVGLLAGTGWISANGGGYQVGGGGGRISVRHETLELPQDHIEVKGGQGSQASGGNGTLFLKAPPQTFGDLVVDGHGAGTPDNLCVMPGGYAFDNMIFRNRASVLADETLVVNGTLRLESASVMTHSLLNENGVQLRVGRLEIDATSAIDVSARGYRGGNRDGNANVEGETLGGLPGSPYRSGGCHGGLGGRSSGSGPLLSYGMPSAPVHLGSGGSQGAYSSAGGNGGGRVRIEASEAVVVDGEIRANGGLGSGNQSGSGAGGSIHILTKHFDGSGRVRAEGGGHQVGGGGGRIGIEYETINTNAFDSLRRIIASGGRGSSVSGSAGSVWFRNATQSFGDLCIDDAIIGSTASCWSPMTLLGFGAITGISDDTFVTDGKVPLIPNGLVGAWVNPNIARDAIYQVIANTESSLTVRIESGYALTNNAAVGDTYAAVHRFDNLTIRGGTLFVLGDKLVVDGAMRIVENSVVTHYGATTNFGSRIDIHAGALHVDASGAINVNARGYLGGRSGGNIADWGETLDHMPGSTYRSGGSHGGLGGSYGGGTPNPLYGSSSQPATLGSGGSVGSCSAHGGNGGGWIDIRASSMRLDGTITADGGVGSGNQSGSGSGGSILLQTAALDGSGVVRANGGAYQVGGGGGRLALYFDGTRSSTGALTLTASGGTGSSVSGQPGTLHIESNFAGPPVPIFSPIGELIWGSEIWIENINPSGIRWNAQDSDEYIVEFADTLLTTNWMPASSAIRDGRWSEMRKERRAGFYRVRRNPKPEGEPPSSP